MKPDNKTNQKLKNVELEIMGNGKIMVQDGSGNNKIIYKELLKLSKVYKKKSGKRTSTLWKHQMLYQQKS